MLTSFVLALLLGTLAAPAQAQTLADAARREAERRARLTETKKVFTDADLEALPTRGGAAPAATALLAPAAAGASQAASAASVATPAAETSDAAPPADATVREKRDEQHWRERAQVIRERLNRLQSDATALEGRVGGLQAEIDAASGSQRAALADDLRQASAMLTRVQGELRLIQGEWRQFEDRAVEAKIPPAWIR